MWPYEKFKSICAPPIRLEDDQKCYGITANYLCLESSTHKMSVGMTHKMSVGRMTHKMSVGMTIEGQQNK